MIRALENNTLGLVLATLCGVFLMLGLGLAVMWAMPPSAGPDDVDETEAEVAAAMAALESTRPFEEYAVIGQRPVFNEDRRPAPVIEVDGDPEPFDPDDVVGAPEVELAGIVITPSLRLATLRSKDQQYSLVAFEGQPLEGDYGSWQVSRIDERMVTLASAEGEEMQLRGAPPVTP
jgi:general secretion pathway protein N